MIDREWMGSRLTFRETGVTPWEGLSVHIFIYVTRYDMYITYVGHRTRRQVRPSLMTHRILPSKIPHSAKRNKINIIGLKELLTIRPVVAI